MMTQGGCGHGVQLWNGDERRQTQQKGFGASALPVSEESAELRGTTLGLASNRHHRGEEKLGPGKR